MPKQTLTKPQLIAKRFSQIFCLIVLSYLAYRVLEWRSTLHLSDSYAQWFKEYVETPLGNKTPKLPEELADAFADEDHRIHDMFDYEQGLEAAEKLRKLYATSQEGDQETNQETRK